VTRVKAIAIAKELQAMSVRLDIIAHDLREQSNVELPCHEQLQNQHTFNVIIRVQQTAADAYLDQVVVYNLSEADLAKGEADA
jgi:hypothetical protein